MSQQPSLTPHGSRISPTFARPSTGYISASCWMCIQAWSWAGRRVPHQDRQLVVHAVLMPLWQRPVRTPVCCTRIGAVNGPRRNSTGSWRRIR
jgi:hypothetical protein